MAPWSRSPIPGVPRPRRSDSDCRPPRFSGSSPGCPRLSARAATGPASPPTAPGSPACTPGAGWTSGSRSGWAGPTTTSRRSSPVRGAGGRTAGPGGASPRPAGGRSTRSRGCAPTRTGRCTREEVETALHIALIEPKIPPNTGNIARLCAAPDPTLPLMEPLGFSIADADLRRAGLDYWDAVDLWVHSGWREFREAIARERCLYFSARAERPLADAEFRSNSVLVFGNETDGMPDRILEKHPDRCFTIPMPGGKVRSLKLATAAGIVL